MALYQWNTEIYNITRKYFWKKWLKRGGPSPFGTLTVASAGELQTIISNIDIYPFGAQIIINLGVLGFDHFAGGDHSILPHPVEEGKHLREYIASPSGGQMGYLYPFKFRTAIFM